MWDRTLCFLQLQASAATNLAAAAEWGLGDARVRCSLAEQTDIKVIEPATPWGSFGKQCAGKAPDSQLFADHPRQPPCSNFS
jgi:hypothetical protein